jgi:hypothetical protein
MAATFMHACEKALIRPAVRIAALEWSCPFRTVETTVARPSAERVEQEKVEQ